MSEADHDGEGASGLSFLGRAGRKSGLRLDFLGSAGRSVKHRLDPARMVETAESLAREIGERLPGSSLAGLAAELASLAHATDERTKQARAPIHALRAASAAAIGVGSLTLLLVALRVHARWEFATITELFVAVQAGINLSVLLAGAAWFLGSFEARIKRRRTLESIAELREFVHVVDLTQLYFTPDLYGPEPSVGKLRLDHTYLLFCTRMLGLLANLAALRSRGVAVDSIIRAAFEVELLANTITAKLQSKVEAIRSAAGRG